MRSRFAPIVCTPDDAPSAPATSQLNPPRNWSAPAIRFAATLLAVAPFFAVACGNADTPAADGDEGEVVVTEPPTTDITPSDSSQADPMPEDLPPA